MMIVFVLSFRRKKPVIVVLDETALSVYMSVILCVPLLRHQQCFLRIYFIITRTVDVARGGMVPDDGACCRSD